MATFFFFIAVCGKPVIGAKSGWVVCRFPVHCSVVRQSYQNSRFSFRGNGLVQVVTLALWSSLCKDIQFTTSAIDICFRLDICLLKVACSGSLRWNSAAVGTRHSAKQKAVIVCHTRLDLWPNRTTSGVVCVSNTHSLPVMKDPKKTEMQICVRKNGFHQQQLLNPGYQQSPNQRNDDDDRHRGRQKIEFNNLESSVVSQGPSRIFGQAILLAGTNLISLKKREYVSRPLRHGFC